MGVSLNAKRFIVCLIAAALVILAALSLWRRSSGVVHIIFCAIVIAAGCLGFCAAWQFRHPSWLRFFEWTSWVLAIYGIITIIVDFVRNDVAARDVGWDIAQTALLIIGATFAHDLHRSVGHKGHNVHGHHHGVVV
jgi:hypothetical protein